MSLSARMRPKKCRNPECRETFVPARPLQIVCGMTCALALAKVQMAQEAKRQGQQARAKQREAMAKVKTRAEHLKEAQAAFNAWVRERDRDLPCISCGRHHQGQYHAGHYRSVGSSPALRFEELNVHKQCAPCNNHKSGNAIEYRLGLVRKIGAELVEWLEGPHPAKRYSIEDLQGIKAHYRALFRDLKRGKA